MEIKDECIKRRNDKKIVIAEGKAKITFINENQRNINKVNLNCVFKQLENEKRCDGLLIDNDKKYFVELKGKNITKAVEQLKNTIKILKADNNIIAFIIYSGSPRLTTVGQSEKLKWERNMKSKLEIKETYCKFDLDKRKFIHSNK